MSRSFSTTLAELEQSADRPERFSACFLDVLPVTGASVSTIGDTLGSETVSATDDVAARLDELQFDLSEGPCWDAMRTAAPVSEPDFARQGPKRWPAFGAAVGPGGVASIFAFPLTVGDLHFGAVDLYSRSPLELSERQCEQASTMADVIGRHVLSDALSTVADPAAEHRPYSRRVVHQATGIVLAQLDVDPNDALLMIQARAYSTGESMMAVSREITEGRLRFVRTSGGIEART